MSVHKRKRGVTDSTACNDIRSKTNGIVIEINLQVTVKRTSLTGLYLNIKLKLGSGIDHLNIGKLPAKLRCLRDSNKTNKR